MGTQEIWHPSGAENTQFKMIDVGAKTATHRRAVAQGKIHIPKATLYKIHTGTMPKGNVLAMAEVAGIQAAKKTSEILPLCHPLSLDSVRVWYDLDLNAETIIVFCEACAFSKTGVEMEALCGVQAALLAIYDLTKGIEPALQIGDIRLKLKEGGKSGSWKHPLEEELAKLSPEKNEKKPELFEVRAAVVVVSDRCARGEAVDQSGAALKDLLIKDGSLVISKEIVPDEAENIRNSVKRLALEDKVDFIAVTGGTGIGPRDITPEALEDLWTKKISGIGELIRESSNHPKSRLSRAEAGMIGMSLVVLFPGSVSGATEGYAAIKKILPHALHILKGGAH